MPARAPFASPSSRMPPRPGARCSAGGLQVVVQRVGEQAGVAGAQRLQHVGVDGGRVAAARRRCPWRVPARAAGRARGRRPGVDRPNSATRAPSGTPCREGGAQLVAAAGADRGAAGEGERHVGAERRRRARAAPPSAGRCPRARRRRRAWPRHPPNRRPCRRRSARSCRSRGARRRGTPVLRASSFAARIARFEPSVGSPDVSIGPPNATREVVVVPRAHVLVERDRLVGGGDVVVAVVASSAPTLRKTLILPGARACTRRRRPPRSSCVHAMPLRGSGRRMPAARAIGRGSPRRQSCSPSRLRVDRPPAEHGRRDRRRPAETPARATAAASCGAAGTRRRRARTSHAARPRCRAPRRVRSRRARSRRSAPARTPARDLAGDPPCAVPRRLDARPAVDLRAGPGGEPVPDLGLHHDDARLRATAKCSSRCRSTGTETLYGRFATSRTGSPGSSVTRSASSCTTVSVRAGLHDRRRCAAAGRRGARRSRRRSRRRPPRAARASASRARGRSRAPSRRAARRRSARCAAPCWRRARSSGRASSWA